MCYVAMNNVQHCYKAHGNLRDLCSFKGMSNEEKRQQAPQTGRWLNLGLEKLMAISIVISFFYFAAICAQLVPGKLLQ